MAIYYSKVLDEHRKLLSEMLKYGIPVKDKHENIELLEGQEEMKNLVRLIRDKLDEEITKNTKDSSVWELIEFINEPDILNITKRLRVNNGWIVSCNVINKHGSSVSSSFVPDKSHSWNPPMEGNK